MLPVHMKKPKRNWNGTCTDTPNIPNWDSGQPSTKKPGKFIGRCGLLPWTIDGQREVEVAYTITQEYWGQGLATEAARGILEYGFEKLNLSRLICLIDPENIASQRVAEKIGMTLEKKVDGIDGDNYPTLIYSSSKQATPDA